MKRLLSILLLFLVSFGVLAPPFAEAARVKVVRRGKHHRTVVVVRRGHPIRRSMHAVVYRRPAVVVRVAPVRFLPLVAWGAVVVATRPAVDAMAWQDAETLYAEEEWAETIFDSDQRGTKLYLEVVKGQVQFDFAEVTFENGDCQVVDFNSKPHGEGFYSLLDFADGRKVDHVRLIARSKSDESRVALIMQK
ncbi:MAG: hypothetical protein IT348_01665 [Candidatus Eisenbacteria bacterium]|nr:hypothetical protein [Candidatus Eisenbacteria bacterium]